jgi:methylated-DNA-[protein]-cysteine S-methyltransferase
MPEYSGVIDTPLGPVGVTWKDRVLTGVDLEPRNFEESAERLPSFVTQQLDAYFREGSASFDLPVALSGTPFQRRVWAVLRSIPSGRTLTYGEIARKLGTSARAIGGACRANPCPIVVPCHRVVAAKGLGGFAGDTSGRKLEAKRWLLRHEGNREFPD